MQDIRTKLTLTAGLVIVVLTAAAFWLSYAHLHDVAVTYGLAGSPRRAWAWPATLDLFIVAGEIMMLVAALAKRKDAWAIGLTVAGSVGSIALNVLGVGEGANALQYVVAAVPPSAALLAFGALMRQVHSAVEKTQAPEPAEVPAGDSDRNQDDEEDDDQRDEDERQDDDQDEEEVIPLPLPATKPTVDQIAAAAADLESDGLTPTGAALAKYFGVSDRTGRRYRDEWQAAQAATA